MHMPLEDLRDKKCHKAASAPMITRDFKVQAVKGQFKSCLIYDLENTRVDLDNSLGYLVVAKTKLLKSCSLKSKVESIPL